MKSLCCYLFILLLLCIWIVVNLLSVGRDCTQCQELMLNTVQGCPASWGVNLVVAGARVSRST